MGHDKRKHNRDERSRKHLKSRRERRSSTHSSAGSAEEKFNERLKKMRSKELESRVEKRMEQKAKETAEEKSLRRLAKKQRKEEKRRLKDGSSYVDGIEYTNLNNPFNDPNITSTFIWNKKFEADGCGKMPLKERVKMTQIRALRNMKAVEELKRNREIRESVREDYAMIRRDEEGKMYGDWERTEGEFHFKQAKLRSKIRLKEGRGKPIDFLTRFISYDDYAGIYEEEGFITDHPLDILNNITTTDLEDLVEDIKVCRQIDHMKNSSWWNDLSIIVNDRLKRSSSDVRSLNSRDSVHASVLGSIDAIFKGKDLSDLSKMEAQMSKKIRGGEHGVDTAYWESVLEHLHAHMAKMRVGNKYRSVMEKVRIGIKKDVQADTQDCNRDKIRDEHHNKFHQDQPSSSEAGFSSLTFTVEELYAYDSEVQEQKWRSLNDEESEHFAIMMYEKGSYSPPYRDEKQAMPGIELLDDVEDLKKREELMNRMRSKDPVLERQMLLKRNMKSEVSKNSDSYVEPFSEETPLEVQTFLWSEKYRPRKPRYFNRVHTGFEWNKYNQTHYDMDNPPPKIVQGYRFNIFYPDLLDLTETPSFTVTPCDDPDFAVLRFHAGPPYEDIAFKIVNKEWEISHKHGYKCQFEKGIFQLWFSFKRYRYRR